MREIEKTDRQTIRQTCKQSVKGTDSQTDRQIYISDTQTNRGSEG